MDRLSYPCPDLRETMMVKVLYKSWPIKADAQTQVASSTSPLFITRVPCLMMMNRHDNLVCITDSSSNMSPIHRLRIINAEFPFVFVSLPKDICQEQWHWSVESNALLYNRRHFWCKGNHPSVLFTVRWPFNGLFWQSWTLFFAILSLTWIQDTMWCLITISVYEVIMLPISGFSRGFLTVTICGLHPPIRYPVLGCSLGDLGRWLTTISNHNPYDWNRGWRQCVTHYQKHNYPIMI